MPISYTAAGLLEKIRKTAPLIHNITNLVVMNATANILLAMGASPVMAHSDREVVEMTSLSGALVLNIGTLSDPWVRAMCMAGKAANTLGLPVILDPVGAGATSYRTDSVRQILDEVSISVIRGNASEVLSLSDTRVRTKGVDSSLALSDAAIDTARKIARRHHCIVAISGEKDLITDGDRNYRVSGGVSLMTRVTGLGCGLSATVGAFCAVASDDDRLSAVASAMGFYGLCGEVAYRVSNRPGSFFVAFIDTLYTIDTAEIIQGLRIEAFL
ncbi:hydroxyethylthiazole kinase [Desulfosarcina sp. OttesenSCG-928-A07]|nr:hydroxyethylthiazole kinase [Desulfosarcina sp. OttesenSCG-928-G17]MDL2328280.1 hydroxyethylthiazole kinase [Desulfosarcina sp. OttesenSCG-928-A07]